MQSSIEPKAKGRAKGDMHKRMPAKLKQVFWSCPISHQPKTQGPNLRMLGGLDHNTAKYKEGTVKTITLDRKKYLLAIFNNDKAQVYKIND